MSRKRDPFNEFYGKSTKKAKAGLCPECGSENIYSEVISRSEWVGNREVNHNYVLYTCLDEICGHQWQE